jgi:hypothetical protein
MACGSSSPSWDAPCCRSCSPASNDGTTPLGQRQLAGCGVPRCSTPQTGLHRMIDRRPTLAACPTHPGIPGRRLRRSGHCLCVCYYACRCSRGDFTQTDKPHLHPKLKERIDALSKDTEGATEADAVRNWAKHGGRSKRFRTRRYPCYNSCNFKVRSNIRWTN